MTTSSPSITKRKLHKSNNVTLNPTSPGRQHIINNPPFLNTSNLTFIYDNSFFTHKNTASDMVINDAIATMDSNESISNRSLLQDNYTFMFFASSTVFKISHIINNFSQHTQNTFAPDYNGDIGTF